MKGLLLNEAFPPDIGGVEEFLQSLCLFSKHKIDVLTEDTPESVNFDLNVSYNIYRKRVKPHIGFVQYLLAGISLCHRNRYDFIFVGSFSSVLYVAAWLKKLFGIPLVLLYHGFDLERQLQANSTKAIKALQYCDLLITNSHYNFRRYSNLFPSATQTKILNPGVDTEYFKPNNNLKVDLDWLKLPFKNKQVILSIGRLVKKKNHDMVLRSLKKVTKQFPEIIYLIVGNGPEHNNLQKLTDRFSLRENVSFFGSMQGSALVDFYNICDIFILPSKERKMDNQGNIDAETFGIVFMEANACGKPVIGGNSGGIPDAIVNGVTGYLVNPSDENELAEKIIELLSNKEKARRMGEAGRKRTVEEFDWTVVAKKFDRYLGQILS